MCFGAHICEALWTDNSCTKHETSLSLSSGRFCHSTWPLVLARSKISLPRMKEYYKTTPRIWDRRINHGTYICTTLPQAALEVYAIAQSTRTGTPYLREGSILAQPWLLRDCNTNRDPCRRRLDWGFDNSCCGMTRCLKGRRFGLVCQVPRGFSGSSDLPSGR